MAAAAAFVLLRIDFVVWAYVRAMRAASVALVLYVRSSVWWVWALVMSVWEMWRRAMCLRMNLCRKILREGWTASGIMRPGPWGWFAHSLLARREA